MLCHERVSLLLEQEEEEDLRTYFTQADTESQPAPSFKGNLSLRIISTSSNPPTPPPPIPDEDSVMNSLSPDNESLSVFLSLS